MQIIVLLWYVKVLLRSYWKAMNISCYISEEEIYGLVVVIKQLNDFQRWKNSVSYRSRWIVDGVLSSMKRIFGDHVSARKFANMVKEMMIKSSVYNIFIGMK